MDVTRFGREVELSETQVGHLRYQSFYKRHRRFTMKLKAISAALAVAAALLVGATPAAAADKDCSDFNSWREAQKFYKRHGGPQRDPHRLDADRDGIACESLR
jgi:hypothetical protein